MVLAVFPVSRLSLVSLAAVSLSCAARPGPGAASGLAPCDADDPNAPCDYGAAPQSIPLRGFERVPFDTWGGQWQRGDEQLWITKSRAPDYPVTEGGLRLRVDATRACNGQLAAVRKTFTLPPFDSATATTVLFFTLDGRAYQVGYVRPLKRAASKDVLDFMSRFCGS